MSPSIILGPALHATYQYITERPELEDEAEDVVYLTNLDSVGEERTEGDSEL